LLDDVTILASFPDAAIDHDNLSFFRGLLEQSLLLNRCDECGHWHHPPSPTCPACWSQRLTPTEVKGTGTVQLVVTAYHPVPMAGLPGPGPNLLVTLELDEQAGLRFTAPAVGEKLSDFAIGSRAELVWFDLGVGTLPVVRPAG
jgi:uncharacterized protein